MKDLIKVVVNADLPDLCLKAWYYHLEGVELIVTESDIPSEWKLPDNELWIDKKYCTVLQSDTQPEPVPFCSRTDGLFKHLLERYDISYFSTSQLDEIINVVYETTTPNTKEVKGNFVSPKVEGKIIVDIDQDVLDHIMKEERIPFDLGKWDTGKFDVITHNGNKVENLTRNESLDMQLFGVNNKRCRQWDLSGKYYEDGSVSDYNLFLIPKTKTVWVNEFKSVHEYNSEEEAKMYATSFPGYNFMQTIQVNKPIE